MRRTPLPSHHARAARSDKEGIRHGEARNLGLTTPIPSETMYHAGCKDGTAPRLGASKVARDGWRWQARLKLRMTGSGRKDIGAALAGWLLKQGSRLRPEGDRRRKTAERHLGPLPKKVRHQLHTLGTIASRNSSSMFFSQSEHQHHQTATAFDTPPITATMEILAHYLQRAVLPEANQLTRLRGRTRTRKPRIHRCEPPRDLWTPMTPPCGQPTPTQPAADLSSDPARHGGGMADHRGAMTDAGRRTH